MLYSAHYYYQANQDPPIVIEDNIGKQIEHLAFCESSNRPHIIVEDDGGSPSYGLLQFKEITFNWATKRLGLGDLDIMNPDHQKAVARELLVRGEWKHWFNCLKNYERK